MMILFFVLLTLFVYTIEPRRFINVYILGLTMAMILTVVLVYVLPDITKESSRVTQFYYVLFFAIIPITLLILSSLTFFSSKILLEKEGRRLKNLLFSAFGIGMTGMVVWYYLSRFSNDNSNANEIIFLYFACILLYVLDLFTSTTVYAICYHFRKVTYKPAYIIVLGSGLIGKKVPPLLASRINKAVEVWRKNPEAIIVFSGGQGADELVSEASAMKVYALEHHKDLVEDKLFIEDQSVNTYQNFLFSKKIIEQQGKNQKGLFVSNNFHIFRASLYARKVKLRAQGVGSPTASYYLPNAFTREFIALLVMSKKLQITLFVVWTVICGVLLRAYL